MFVDEPLDAWVLVGEKIILPCSPPPGFPQPTVSWWRDGVQLKIDTESRYSSPPLNLMYHGGGNNPHNNQLKNYELPKFNLMIVIF